MTLWKYNHAQRIRYEDIEAIKAGLQQCVVKMDVRNYVIWKKECGKGE